MVTVTQGTFMGSVALSLSALAEALVFPAVPFLEDLVGLLS